MLAVGSMVGGVSAMRSARSVVKARGYGSPMRVSAVQMVATADRAGNLDVATRGVEQAVCDDADLVVLPELFNLLGSSAVMAAGAEPLDGPSVTWACSTARESNVWLLAGTITEDIPDEQRSYNTSCLVSPAGEIVARYRKVHLFDNEVAGAAYRESATVAPGDELVTAELHDHTVGLATCYDLRFPEHFRVLTLAGADLFVVPSAFTHATGSHHWETLLRARAIENQCFIVAANQVGIGGIDIALHGRSMIVDPWGTILAEASLHGEHPDRGDRDLRDVEVVTADLDLDRLHDVRQQLPALAHRRPDVYGWPE